ncbi:hypothetical protein SLS62_007923 [Diatrype stigma]|uniref:BTB domain-containing protein n=1 Tax=Diatrype stigma TaxID=117547 RepID=A0AAN9UN59_9PEZI
MAEQNTSILGSASAEEPRASSSISTTDTATTPAPNAHPTTDKVKQPSQTPDQEIVCKQALMLKQTIELTTVDPNGDLYLRVGQVTCQSSLWWHPGEEGPHDHTRTQEYRVDSRALSRTSPVFMKMLYGPFSESNKSSEDEKWRVALPDDNVKAMGTLLDIMHCRFVKLPAITNAINLEHIYEIAVLTDKYDCTSLVRPWSSSWLGAASALVPKANISDLEMISWVAWEYGDQKLFEKVTKHMIIHLGGFSSYCFFKHTLEPNGLSGMYHMLAGQEYEANWGLKQSYNPDAVR